MHFLQSLLLLVGVDALRTSKRGESASNATSAWTVRGLYTFGAPHTAVGQLENPATADKCFGGQRIVAKNKRLVWQVDIVPTLLVPSSYAHARHDPFWLFQDGTTQRRTCGWIGSTVERPDIGLHSLAGYVDRSQSTPALKDLTRVALHISYEDDVQKAADYVRSKGFGLVASAVCRQYDEVSHLIQDPNTLDCWLTFEGSDNIGDWINNLNVASTPFCGLGQRVHSGFRNSVRHIVDEPDFQNKLRPMLGHCRNVDTVGHSLGGAIATLFTACAHSTATGNGDYKKISFQKKRTMKMPYL